MERKERETGGEREKEKRNREIEREGDFLIFTKHFIYIIIICAGSQINKVLMQ